MLQTKAFILLIMLFPGLGYGGFKYVTESHMSDLGSLHLFVDEERRMNVPVWLGFGALVMSGALLLTVRKN